MEVTNAHHPRGFDDLPNNQDNSLITITFAIIGTNAVTCLTLLADRALKGEASKVAAVGPRSYERVECLQAMWPGRHETASASAILLISKIASLRAEMG